MCLRQENDRVNKSGACHICICGCAFGQSCDAVASTDTHGYDLSQNVEVVACIYELNFGQNKKKVTWSIAYPHKLSPGP